MTTEILFPDKKAISLLDMIQLFVLNQFAADWELFIKTLEHYKLCGYSNPGCYTKTEDLKNLGAAVGHIQFQCKKLELDMAHDRASRLLTDIDRGAGCTYSVVLNELKKISELIISGLGERVLVFIPPERNGFFNQKALFGEDVNCKFPSAVDDIEAAGNCMAADLNTAAVFHLMRVVERGLIALATELSVSIPKKELDFKQWNQIIDQINGEIEKAISNVPAGSARYESKEFYHGIMGQFNAFRDVWRNSVMHGRGKYDSHQATSVLNHVCEFMRQLATRIKEQS